MDESSSPVSINSTKKEKISVKPPSDERTRFGYSPEEISIDELMARQGYAKAGAHSAVKTCSWLKNSMNGTGVCYKSSFYGVVSHRCLQMTPTLMCNQECVFCWRPTEVPAQAPEEWDLPDKIVEESIRAQRKLITGYGGSPNAVLGHYEEAKSPSNVAISLSGEPTFYPHLPELVSAYESEGLTVFLVTNGTQPEMLRKIKPTQLYVSLDATTPEMYEEVCRPKSPNLWEKVMESLDVLKEKKAEGVRTVIRITAVKGLNMMDEAGYAELIQKAEPDFIEVKSYMHVGFSRLRLERSNMAEQDEIREFAQKIADFAGYQYAGESEPSRVVVLSKSGKLSNVSI
ncbi:MAG: 4-demethylwyosine synthase TYW1 [Methanosarcinales archaeon]|jgi:tRNA wybutosine-synthesizing protein 1|nr:4-demethylwyosine synthase TYW1 [Methanosarcinales archaeon]